MTEQFKPNPFTVLVDTREQSAFKFQNIKGDKSDAVKVGKEKVIPTLIVPVEHKGLKTGDYSIKGLEDRVSIERKSLEDFFHCVGSDRDRFVRQLERLNQLERGVMMIEADWNRILQGAPRSELLPKTVVRSVMAWQQDYFPNVHWWFLGTKRRAELFTFRLLDRFWKKKGQS